MDWEKIVSVLGGHWPFLAVAIILGLVGEVVKGLIVGISKEEAEKQPYKKFFIKTLPLHPVIAGALLGIALSATLPDVVTTGGVISSILYFAVSGAVSSTVYNTLKALWPDAVKAVRKRVAGAVSKPSEPDSGEES